MGETRLGARRWAWVLACAALTCGVGLGWSGRLSYHEAFVAQGAREMLTHGDPLVPTIEGRPWLEKPPLPIWLAALSGQLAGGVTEAAARGPSALAGMLLVGGVALLAARRFGATVGLLSGLVQATTFWAVQRARLAEADIVLACLVVGTIAAFDRLREDGSSRAARWGFWIGLGLTALVKGIGFGAALVAATVLAVLVWDRDRTTIRRLIDPIGWVVAAGLALAWPIAVLARHPEALGLWTLHVADRLSARSEHFTGGPWWLYGPALLLLALPWTPLGVLGAGRSLGRAWGTGGSKGDRLLWAWAVAPVALLSLATVKNAHYAIHALPPWSIWAALSLARIGARLQSAGWSPDRLRRSAGLVFGGLALAFVAGFVGLNPRLDRRGVEWAFYESAGRALGAGEPLALLYDDWDRLPYPSPFGPFPHDLAIRLYYLDRPACWRQGVEELAARPPSDGLTPFAVIGRARDLPGLRRLGRVETILQGPRLRARASRVDDRTFALYRIIPSGVEVEVGMIRR